MPDTTSNQIPDKTIVITRPPGNEVELIEHFQSRGLRVIHEPLTHITLDHTQRMLVTNSLLQDPNAVLLTSRHAVEALAALTELRDMFLICVGEATARKAESHGFYQITRAGGTVDHMIDLVRAAYDDDARFLHISGKHTTLDLPEAMQTYGMYVERIIVYEAVASEELSDTLIEQMKREQIDAMTFLSPRAAKIFNRLAEAKDALQDTCKTDAFCISQAVADELNPELWQNIYIADAPNLASLLECVDNTYGGSA